MNAINRIELAIRRAASQMPAGTAKGFKLVADQLQDAVHEDDGDTLEILLSYREDQEPSTR